MDIGFDHKIEDLKRQLLYRSLKESSDFDFCDNDYLGLSVHPYVIEASKKALSQYGCGSRGSRMLGGNKIYFEEVEEKLADFFNAPAALIFSSGYLCNLSVLNTASLFFSNAYSDELIHASLIDGLRLSNFEKKIVPHNRWDLVDIEPQSLVVAESLYSMEGHFVDLSSLLAHKEKSFFIIDEAHSALLFKEDGKGYLQDELSWDRLVKTLTFGKAFGLSGAAVLCSKKFKEAIINFARPFIYSTAPSPVLFAQILSVLDLNTEIKELRFELWKRAEAVRHILQISGQNKWDNRSPILNIEIGDTEKALKISKSIPPFGLRVIRYPTVAKGKERLRVSLNLRVSWSMTEKMAEGLKKLCKQSL